MVYGKSAATEDTEIMLSWFRMSILFGWNPLTVSRLEYSSVLRIMSLVNKTFRDFTLPTLFQGPQG